MEEYIQEMIFDIISGLTVKRFIAYDAMTCLRKSLRELKVAFKSKTVKIFKQHVLFQITYRRRR